MKTKTTYIKNPSPELLEFARNSRDNKEKRRKELISRKDEFFPKSH